ncbi:MAG: DUF3298 and DUF4163 domain-containing protein, partial [Lachnospiraceae bacterium]|nr:DUF3298 and DUF4163 domain-containing protein [Lachnospiraceae bacterium]
MRKSNPYKKIISLFLIFILSIAVTSCGLKDALQSDTGNSSSEEDTEESDDSDLDEDDEDAGPDAAEMDRPQPVAMRDYTTYYDDDNTLLMYTDISGIVLSEESAKDYPELSAALNEDYDEYREYINGSVDENVEFAKEFRGYNEYFNGFEQTRNPRVMRCDDRVLSIMYDYYGYLGGAHGDYYFGGYNYDVNTGKELSVKDVFKDTSNLNATIKEKLYESYPESAEEFESFGLDETLENYLSGSEGYEYNFSMDLFGVTFQFGPYDLSSYAAGAESVYIPYSEMPDAFNEKYLPNYDIPQIMPVYTGEFSTNLLKLGDDDSLDTLSVYGDLVSEYEMYEGVTIDTGKNKASFNKDNMHYEMTASLILYPSGTRVLWVTELMDNDGHVNSYYDITNGDIKEIGVKDDLKLQMIEKTDQFTGKYVPVNPYHLHLAKRFDILSTYHGDKEYALSEDGTLSASDDLFTVEQSVFDRDLTSTADITGDIIDENGSVISENEVIPAGSSFTLYRTDGKNNDGDEAIVDAILSDG